MYPRQSSKVIALNLAFPRHVYSVEYGKVIDTLIGHDDAVSCMSLTADTLVTGSWDSAVKAWRVTPSALQRLPIADFNDHDTTVKCIHLDSSANLLASASSDGTIKNSATKLPLTFHYAP